MISYKNQTVVRFTPSRPLYHEVMLELESGQIITALKEDVKVGTLYPCAKCNRPVGTTRSMSLPMWNCCEACFAAAINVMCQHTPAEAVAWKSGGRYFDPAIAQEMERKFQEERHAGSS